MYPDVARKGKIPEEKRASAYLGMGYKRCGRWTEQGVDEHLLGIFWQVASYLMDAVPPYTSSHI